MAQPPVTPPPISASQAFDQWLIGKQPAWPFARDWLWKFIAPEFFPLHLTWVFTAILAIFAFTAWRDSKDASEKTSKQLELLRDQQRPWIAPSATSGKACFLSIAGKYYVGFTYKIAIKNIGKSPAIKIPEAMKASQGCAEGNEIIGPYISAKTQVEGSNKAVFPNETSTMNVNSIIPIDSDDQRSFSYNEEFCVPYKYKGVEGWRHTKVILSDHIPKTKIGSCVDTKPSLEITEAD